MRIRDVTTGDLEAVGRLNDAAVPQVNAVPPRSLERFAREAAYFRLAVRNGKPAGLLVAMTPDMRYHSSNFLWFRERYERFVYIDRIVVAADARGDGIGRRLYEDLVAFAAPTAALLACEVNVRPRNEGSLRFHRRFGFETVGTQDTEGGTKTVALMIRPLGGGPAGRE